MSAKKKNNSWIDALKEYNKGHEGAWCVPRKNTPEYKALTNIHKYEIKKTPLNKADAELFDKHKKQIHFYVQDGYKRGGTHFNLAHSYEDKLRESKKYLNSKQLAADVHSRLYKINLLANRTAFNALKK